MNRIVTILLIPLFVVGNALAHSHGTVAHPSNVQTRSHVHVSGGSHHDQDAHDSHHHHSHDHDHRHHGQDHQNHDQDGESSDSTPVAPVEHESDAVYLVAVDWLFTPSERCLLVLDSQFLHATAISVIPIANRQPNLNTPLFFRTAELPLYLLHAAQRL